MFGVIQEIYSLLNCNILSEVSRGLVHLLTAIFDFSINSVEIQELKNFINLHFMRSSSPLSGISVFWNIEDNVRDYHECLVITPDNNCCIVFHSAFVWEL